MEFDPQSVQQYAVCMLYGRTTIMAIDNRNKWFRQVSYGWSREYGVPSPVPEGTLIMLCETLADAELLARKIDDRLTLERNERAKRGRELRKEARIKRRNAITEKRTIQTQISVAHAQAMLAYEQKVAHLRKQIDTLNEGIDDLDAQISTIENIDQEAMLESMGIEPGKVTVNPQMPSIRREQAAE